jgi:hypothetical protein
MMCGGSRDDHLVTHMRPFSDAAQNPFAFSDAAQNLCVVSCHGLDMPADMMDTGDCGKMIGKRSCSEEPLSGKRACTGHCVGVDAFSRDATGDPRNPRTGKFKFSHSLIIYAQKNQMRYVMYSFTFYFIQSGWSQANAPQTNNGYWYGGQHQAQSAPQTFGMSVKLLDPSRGDLAGQMECPTGRSVIDWEMCPTPFAHVQNYMHGEFATSQDLYCNASSNDSQILPRGC